jgi:hypothetical protein
MQLSTKDHEKFDKDTWGKYLASEVLIEFNS